MCIIVIWLNPFCFRNGFHFLDFKTSYILAWSITVWHTLSDLSLHLVGAMWITVIKMLLKYFSIAKNMAEPTKADNL